MEQRQPPMEPASEADVKHVHDLVGQRAVASATFKPRQRLGSRWLGLCPGEGRAARAARLCTGTALGACDHAARHYARGRWRRRAWLGLG